MPLAVKMLFPLRSNWRAKINGNTLFGKGIVHLVFDALLDEVNDAFLTLI